MIDKLKHWLDKSLSQVPPKTTLGKALYYLDSQWLRLAMMRKAPNQTHTFTLAKAWLDSRRNKPILDPRWVRRSLTLCANAKSSPLTQYRQLCIDNNRAERAIKSFVIGRKNWLFSNTASAAKTSAISYSIIEITKANGLNPVKYEDD